MADTTALHPTAVDLSILKEYRSLQDEVADAYMKARSSIKDIVGVEERINKNLIARVGRQRELINQLNVEKAQLADHQRIAATAQGVDQKNAKRNVAATQQRIKDHQREFDLLNKINRQAILPFLWYFKQIASLFKSMDKSAFEFRMKMGAIRDNVKGLRDMAQSVALEFMHVGVTIDGAYASILALGTEMGSVHVVSKSLVETTALLKSQLGVAEDISAGFFRNMAAVSKTTMQAQKQMAYVTAELSQAAGVPFPEVMKDVAKLSGDALAMISRIPTQIIKASVEARRMNTTLADMAKASRSILNFTESVNAEMEASVLLGKSINLQRARELAYRRDLVGATKEIVRLTRSIDFENLDVFQQEAFAKATGRSVEELLKMVQAEKEIESARRSGDPAVRAQLAAYEKMRDANAETLKSSSKNLEMIIRQRANQERLTAISNKWNQIVAQAASAFLPVVELFLTIVPYAIDFVRILFSAYAILGSIGLAVTNIGLVMSKLTSFSLPLFELFVNIQRFGFKILSVFNMFKASAIVIGGMITKWLGPLAKFVSPFLKLLGPIGWIITAGQAIYGFIKGWNEETGSFGEKLKSGVMGALRAIIPGFDWIVEKLTWLWEAIGPIGRGIFKWLNPIGLMISGIGWLIDNVGNIGDAIISTFDNAWTVVKGWFGASPSDIGMSIVNGITSVGSMLVTSLTSPFQAAFAWIADMIAKLPFMGGIAEKLRGLNPFGGGAVEKRAGEGVGNVSTVTATGRTVGGTTTDTEATSAEKAADSTGILEKILASNCEVVAAIKDLTETMRNGGIGVSMDGQLLSATLARQTEFRRGYGVNKV